MNTKKIDFKKYQADIVKFIQKLVSIPSVNGINNEVEIIKTIEEEIIKLELPYKIFTKDGSHPNIFVGENFDKKEGLLLIAHLDTAAMGDVSRWTHNPFSGEIEGNKLFGRGSVDNKAGVALSIYTLKMLKDENKLPLAKFIGVADEEKGADSVYGARYILDSGLQAKAAIYTYPGNDVITIGHRGQVKLWVNVIGESAHSGSQSWQEGTKGASAIEALNKFLNKISSLNLEGSHPVFYTYKFKQTVLYIEGGNVTSLVPDKAKALIDARLLPNHSNDEYIEKIKNISKEFENEKIKFSVEIQTNLPAAFIERDEKIVTTLQGLTNEVFKNNPEVRGCGPANEGYMFINSGIPTICGYGVSGDGAHSRDEYLEIDSIPKILEIYTKAALTL